MDLLLDRIEPRGIPALRILFELPELDTFRLSSDVISMSDRVGKKIIENLQQGLKEHTQRSIQKMQLDQQRNDFYNKIFNSKRT